MTQIELQQLEGRLFTITGYPFIPLFLNEDACKPQMSEKLEWAKPSTCFSTDNILSGKEPVLYSYLNPVQSDCTGNAAIAYMFAYYAQRTGFICHLLSDGQPIPDILKDRVIHATTPPDLEEAFTYEIVNESKRLPFSGYGYDNYVIFCDSVKVTLKNTGQCVNIDEDMFVLPDGSYAIPLNSFDESFETPVISQFQLYTNTEKTEYFEYLEIADEQALKHLIMSESPKGALPSHQFLKHLINQSSPQNYPSLRGKSFSVMYDKETGEPIVIDTPKPKLVITLEGGLVTSIVSDKPDFCPSDIAIVNYDESDCDAKDDMVEIDQGDGTECKAYVVHDSVGQAAINLGNIFTSQVL